jgi:hypothetical protein
MNARLNVSTAALGLVAVLAMPSIQMRIGAGDTGQAFAQPLPKDQARCVASVNKGAANLDNAVGKELERCLKLAGKGALGATSIVTCVTNDEQGKIGKAADKITRIDAKLCGNMPPYGYTGAASTIAGVLDAKLGSLEQVLGSATGDDVGAEPCALATLDTWNDYQRLALKIIGHCKGPGLKDHLIVEINGIGFCLVGSLDDTQVLDAAVQLVGKIRKYCNDAEIRAAFQGECAFEPSLSVCMIKIARCSLCKTMVATDGILADCDELDDGDTDNDSCN